MDLPFTPELLKSKSFKEIQKLNPDWHPNLESTYNYPPASRRTFIVKILVEDKKITDLRLILACINSNSQPAISAPEDDKFTEIVDYLREITASDGLRAELEVAGSDIVIREIGEAY